jgi:hypothetical protein
MTQTTAFRQAATSVGQFEPRYRINKFDRHAGLNAQIEKLIAKAKQNMVSRV